MLEVLGRPARWLDRWGAARRVAGKAPPAERPDPAQPPGTGRMPEIRHVVVLMMENHSYDNYLGMLDRGDGLPRSADGTPTAVDSGVRAHHLPSTRQHEAVPPQSWPASHLQYDGGACDGFVTSVRVTEPRHADDADVVMGYWQETDLPFYYALARTFCVADHWFCSCLGPTFPNRRFLIAGTAHGLIDDHPLHLFDTAPGGTIFDLLSAHEITWANYHPGSRLAALVKRLLGTPGLCAGRWAGSALARLVPSLLDLLDGKVQFTADLYPLGLGGALTHLRSLDDFFTDAAAGTLPAFSIVDPDYRRFSEENPQDVQLGESFASDVVNAVMHGKGWPHTLLIWCYDEHGGYYDHVPPPAAVEPDDVLPATRRRAPVAGGPAVADPVTGDAVTGDAVTADPVVADPAVADPAAGGDRYDRLGFRVPAVVVSPYSRPGAVDSTVYDHTSVLRLLQVWWNLPPLTRRDAAATPPLAALDLGSAPALLDPPSLPPPALGPGAWR